MKHRIELLLVILFGLAALLGVCGFMRQKVFVKYQTTFYQRGQQVHSITGIGSPSWTGYDCKVFIPVGGGKSDTVAIISGETLVVMEEVRVNGGH